MTKKQLEVRLLNHAATIASLTATIENREDRLVEHSNEIGRMLKVIDDVEAANRDLHVQKMAMQTKINHLTSVAKSLTAVL